MQFALRSRWAVMQRIKHEARIGLHVRAVGKHLVRRSFTPQRPIQRAHGQSPAAVHCSDETALVNTDVRGRSVAPRGTTPAVMAVGGTRRQ